MCWSSRICGTVKVAIHPHAGTDTSDTAQSSCTDRPCCNSSPRGDRYRTLLRSSPDASALQFIPTRGQILLKPDVITVFFELQFIPTRGQMLTACPLLSASAELQFIPTRGQMLNLLSFFFRNRLSCNSSPRGDRYISVQSPTRAMIVAIHPHAGTDTLVRSAVNPTDLPLQFIPTRGQIHGMRRCWMAVCQVAIHPHAGTNTLWWCIRRHTSSKCCTPSSQTVPLLTESPCPGIFLSAIFLFPKQKRHLSAAVSVFCIS